MPRQRGRSCLASSSPPRPGRAFGMASFSSWASRGWATTRRDSSLQQIEARSAAAAAAERKALAAEQRAQEANPEEIELDMDDDEDDAPGAEPPPAASSSAAVAMTANSEEIELNVEDIEEAPIPSEVFGGGLSSMRANLPDWETVEEPPLAAPAPAAEEKKKLGALAKFQKKGKGKGGSKG
ncbi:Hypothetical protein SCF082_LOCUS43970 [Durusdinium trenchii]|uniref:Uncharacterized protein n=1 Tax=Durusdinium trenchii TaxID=1381693 RepID=A0ABP0QYU8_9DINO